MKIVIDKQGLTAKDISEMGYLPLITTEDGEYYLAQSSKQAGEAARQYWQDMIKFNKKEFVAIIGQETLVSWALGEFAGPGTEQVQSLEEWLNLWLRVPAEQWATYDNAERNVDYISPTLQKKLGFTPKVAYRAN